MSQTDRQYTDLKQAHSQMLDKLLADTSFTHCYIRKSGSYYREGYCGYTEFRIWAGVYTKQDAIIHCSGVIECTPIPINVSEHNAFLNEQIELIKRNLIQPF